VNDIGAERDGHGGKRRSRLEPNAQPPIRRPGLSTQKKTPRSEKNVGFDVKDAQARALYRGRPAPGIR
jgi:hypothetical protein